MPRVVIVGAGLSGLAVAFRLRTAWPSVELTVLESRERTGGNIGTVDRDGFRVECGPNGFLDNKPGTAQLCRDLGLGERMIPGSEDARKNRFVFLRDRLHKLPGSPLGILTTPLLSFAGKLAMLREPFRPKLYQPVSDETVAAFARRRFGREAADVFMNALVTGIHAGDPERLSVRAAFPRLPKFENENGSVLRGFLAAAKVKKHEAQSRGEKPAPQRMWSFREGLRVIIDTMAERIGSPVSTGVRVRSVTQNPSGSGWIVRGEGRSVWSADAVVMACPAYEQSVAIADLNASLAAELAAIRYNRVVVAALGYRRSDVTGPQDGFGYIAPENTRRDILGVQWCSSIFPERAPPGMVLWRVLCGGVNRADVFDWDDDTLTQACHREMQHAMGVRGEPVFRQIVRWPRAIPQYEVGHLERVAKIESAVAMHPGLFVTGNAFHGIAMNDVTEQAALTAANVADYLRRG